MAKYLKQGGRWWYVRVYRGQLLRASATHYRCISCKKRVLRVITKTDPAKVFCSIYCKNAAGNMLHRKQWRGAASPNWRGGKKQHMDGYVTVYRPTHPAAKSSNYVLEHRLVMERYLGRYLLPEETVHHKNGIKHDNRVTNLELWTSKHPAGQRVEDLVLWAQELLTLYAPALIMPLPVLVLP